LRSKLVKKTKGKKMIWLSWATCSHTHTLTLVYFHRRPAQIKKTWRIGRIVMDDGPKNGKKEEWSCCNGWPTQMEEWSHCNGWPTQIKKMENGRVVMGDLPKNGKKEEWLCCNGWPTQVEEWSHCNGWPTQIKKHGEWSSCNRWPTQKWKKGRVVVL
jgi:hypothetical protein